MRFRIEVFTLDGKLSYERETPADALAVAQGGQDSLGISIVDEADGKSYTAEEFGKQFGNQVGSGFPPERS